MHIFKLAGRVALRHRGLLALYVLMMAAFGFLMASYVGDDTSSYQETRPTVAVIDRDGSALSGAIADFVLGAGTPVELPDTACALQDAAAKDLATYVLVIPEGYGDALVRAAREGGAMPILERSVSFQGAQGSLMDEHVRAFAQRLFALLTFVFLKCFLIFVGFSFDRSFHLRYCDIIRYGIEVGNTGKELIRTPHLNNRQASFRQ